MLHLILDCAILFWVGSCLDRGVHLNAYRAGRGAQEAVTAVHRLLATGHQQVIDADLSGYFDSIPHAELMKSVARRIVDRHMLHLIKQWLEVPVEEDAGHGHRKRTTHNRDTGRGTPQGAPNSPLLSNLYMRRFLLGWQQQGYHHRWSAHIINYADDFVICCRGQAEEALTAMRAMMATLKLTVNEEKTHVCRLPQERFDFLGYTFGRCYSPRTGRAYLGSRPAAKSIKRMVSRISQETDRRRTWLEAEVVVGRLNRQLTGWANYFCLGPVSPAYRAINAHVTRRLRRWLGVSPCSGCETGLPSPPFALRSATTLVPRFAPLRATATSRRAPKGAVGLRHGPPSNGLTAYRMRLHLASAASGHRDFAPLPRRPDARADAYRGLPAFASLSMAGSGSWSRPARSWNRSRNAATPTDNYHAAGLPIHPHRH